MEVTNKWRKTQLSTKWTRRERALKAKAALEGINQSTRKAMKKIQT